MNQHFEGHGDNFAAMGFHDPNKFTDVLSKAVHKGSPIVSLCSPKPDAMPMVYSNGGSIAWCVLLERSPQGGVQVFSAFPFLKGCPIKLKINDTHTWENGVEGEVYGVYRNELALSFFAPFYYKQFLNTSICDDEITVNLAALAYGVQCDVKSTEVNDDSTKIDPASCDATDTSSEENEIPPFPSTPKLFLQPTDTCSIYAYRGRVLAVEEIKLMKTSYKKVKLGLTNNGKTVNESPSTDDLTLDLFISEPILKSYQPAVGDIISGGLWLSGYLDFDEQNTIFKNPNDTDERPKTIWEKITGFFNSFS